MIDALQRQALIGLQGAAPPSHVTGDAAIDACLQAALAHATPAQALLRQTALAAVAARSQRAPARPALPPLPQVPDDARPLVPAHASDLIAALVRSGDDDDLVAPLLHDVGAERRLPETLLVALLAHARDDAVRQALREVGGPRLAWLGAVNPAWAWCVDTDDGDPAAQFDIVAGAERAAALRAWRRSDPAAARARVQAGWHECSPDERAALLGAFAIGLGPADEDFIEQALDDRRKEVRIVARDLLARLPESQLVQRCVARVQPLFSYGESLEIALPAAHDRAMARDGIEAKPPTGRGERQHWLLQLLEVTPPAALAARLSIDMRALLRLFAAHDDRALLLPSIALAARRQPDTAAIDAWVDVLDAHPLCAEQFLRVLAPRAMERDGEARLQRLLSDRTLSAQLFGHLGGLLAALPQPWSRSFAAALRTALDASAASTDGGIRWGIGRCLLLAASKLEPRDGFDPWRECAATGTLNDRDIARYLQRLDLRAQVHQLTRSR